ncbi:right-handed parallel beta-helix repeat-containing protein [Arthrobacter sp. SX1312]|uniref:right-handed parallel beta-helix repeat-containing protein n=1 Tax=Arthrobacter sp. SX1312 TaxID=2058896 RepID=UPI000CE3CCDA|nr:right-handed parallel beta-helix repeat-containing protein [Arthrobacter sp. SX1312]
MFSSSSLPACSRVAAAAVAVVAVSLIASPASAAPPTVRADGQALAGSVQRDGAFLASVEAPAGSKVKFKVDGTYLGQDTTAPYTWPVAVGAGTHKLEVRWESPAGRQESTVSFSVATPRPAAPAPAATPALKPAPAPAPRQTSKPTPKPTPKPISAPAPTSTPAPANVVQVSTAAGLKTALANARPGQVIELRDGRYIGAFKASASGTAASPITLRGSRGAVLSSGSTSSGYGLHVTGSHWRITGVAVASSAKGIVLDGSRNTIIDGVDVGTIGAEAVHFRSGSSDGAIRNSFIHDTGLKQPGYGEGIYLGSARSNWSRGVADRSDRIEVRNNRITNTSAEGIDVKEGTTGGVIIGNTFTNAGGSGANFADSWVDVKGNGYRIEGNTGFGTKLDAFQVHSVLAGWGTGNSFAGNTVQGGVPGYEVWVQSAALRTVIACEPSGAARGLSNIACR